MKRGPKALLFAVILVVLAAAVALLPVREWLILGISWIDAHRTQAWIAYVLAYVVATVLLMPGSILTVPAGFVFGLPLGVVLVSAGSVLGAACAFGVGRFFAREWVAARVARLPRFKALDRATRNQGFVIVLLARLSPLFPFNLLNYGLGVTGVRFRDYILASWIGMLPGTVLYVYLGTLAQDLTQLTTGQVEGGWPGRALFVAGFVATLILTVLVTRKATRALGTHLQHADAEGQ
jgi:uncharacterized membrane protein YdjX (TVP38/TMEM64 family)